MAALDTVPLSHTGLLLFVTDVTTMRYADCTTPRAAVAGSSHEKRGDDVATIAGLVRYSVRR